MVEHPKSKSTQPRYSTTRVTLYLSPQSYEYARSGVKIVSLEPMYVSTRMVGYSSLLDRPSLGVPSAETYVRHALQGCHFVVHCDIAHYSLRT